AGDGEDLVVAAGSVEELPDFLQPAVGPEPFEVTLLVPLPVPRARGHEALAAGFAVVLDPVPALGLVASEAAGLGLGQLLLRCHDHGVSPVAGTRPALAVPGWPGRLRSGRVG